MSDLWRRLQINLSHTEIRRALAHDRLIDIVTVGARTGQKRVVEIWFWTIEGRIIICGTPSSHGKPGRLNARDWLANLRANPRFDFCLKESVRHCLPAQAIEILDASDRRRIMSASQTGWYRRQGYTLEELVEHSPIIEVRFLGTYEALLAPPA